MQGSVSFDINAVDIGAISRFISSKLEDHPIVSLLRCDVKQCLTAFFYLLFMNSGAQLDILQKIVKHVRIVVIDCVKEAVSLFHLTTKPL